MDIEKVPKHAGSYIVICLYCPPAGTTDVFTFEALTRIMKKLDAEGKGLILVGDTNCDCIKPKTSAQGSSSFSIQNFSSNS